jgi:hypothetical protein
MSPEIFNIYVEKLINHITELTKTNLLMSAQLTYTERMNAQLQEQISKLNTEIEQLKGNIANKSAKKNSEADTF